MSDSRLEKFIYAICSMDVTDLPVPLSRIEKLWNCLITGEIPDFEPLSRNEKYLMAMLDRYDISNLPAPMSRGEKLLYKIVVGETDLSDVPGYLSRYEELLKYLIENGGIGFEYVLYTLNQSLSTLYQTVEKPVKSAILKGQTLVNLMNNTPIYENGNCMFELNYKVNEVTIFNYNNLNICCSFWDLNDNWLDLEIFRDSVIHINNPDKKLGCIQMPITDANITQFEQGKFVILEGNHTNKDIPYFEGMQSVRMPVLTTTGKNFFDIKKAENGYLNREDPFAVMPPDSNNKTSDYIKVKPNTTYTYSFDGFDISGLGNQYWTGWYYYISPTEVSKNDSIRYVVQGKDDTFKTVTFTTPSDCHYIRIGSRGLMLDGAVVQLEEGSTATSYEPYKSNILSTSEDVVLRSLPNGVCDTLNVKTGEYVQRIGETFFDGSDDENWTFHALESSGKYCYKSSYTADVSVGNSDGYCDKLIYVNGKESPWHKKLNCVSILNTKWITTYTEHETLDSYKQWLSQNPLTVQYQLATPVVKTVDLTTVDQDGQPTKLKTFNDITYVEIKADNLIPSVDLEVATKINEALSTMGPQQLDISNTQDKLGQTIDEQTENTDATMMATTEIYEQTL